MTVGKGIGGGLAVSAVVGRAAFMSHWSPGTHTSTFMANAVHLAAGLGGDPACSRDERLAERSAELGARMLARLRDALADEPSVGEIRGLGLFGGIEIVTDRESRTADATRTAAIRRAAFDRGVVLGVGGSFENVIKLCPPLTIEDDAARHVARPDHRHHPRDPMTQTTATVITVANYIDGGWAQAASGATIESRDPANGDLVAIAPRSGVEDLDAAIAAARRTFDDGAWPATSGRERASILMELAGLLRAEAEPLARLIAIEMGKPIRYVREREIAPAIDRIEFYAAAARMIRGEVTASAPEPPPELHPQGAGRRVRAHHPVERPGRPAAAQDRRGDRDRLHVRAQAGQRHAGLIDGHLRARSTGSSGSRRASRTGSSARATWSARRSRATRAWTRSASRAAARSAGA